MQWGSASVAVGMLALSAVFLMWRATTPAECATVNAVAAQWSASGVLPDVSASCPLAAGEAVVDARSDPVADRTVVELADSAESITLPLQPPNLLARFASAWSTVLFVVSLFLVAGYAFLRRRTDPAAGALLVLASGLLGSTAVVIVGMPLRFAFDGWQRWLLLVNLEVSYTIAWGGLLAFAVLFPVPIPQFVANPARRIVIEAAPLGTLAVGTTVLSLAIAAPVGSPRWIHGLIMLQSSITVLSLLAGLVLLILQVTRVRQAPGAIARQQGLWIGASGAAAALLVLAFWMVPQLVTGAPLLPPDAIGVPGLLFVAGLLVALLRYRMFDLDALLGRTLVYSALSLVVVVLYLGVVGLLTAVFSTATTTPSAVVGAVVVAIAVNPLRVGLQRSVNRLLYGDRDDPYAALSRVAEQLTATARHRVLPAVAAEVSRAMRVPYVCIEWWTDRQWPAAVHVGNPPPGENDCYDVPLTYRGEHLGRLLVAPRAAGERFAPAERRLLSDIARQVGAAVHDESMSAELQRSRERIVLAREEERRELRRTLHDDIGPTIASIALRAETVRQLAERPSGRVPMDQALDAIGHDATAAARRLRQLSYELRPPALDDRGLLLALRDQAAALRPLLVEISTVDLDQSDREPSNLPAAVEVAAFRIVVSALNNIVQHAAAAHCWVHLVRDDNRLTVEIDDDGTGLPADFRAGVGVTAMRERAAELGGDCTHETRPGGGTRVRARLPIGGGR